MSSATIIWTSIDEAPALASHALLPIVQAFTQGTGITIEARDISLAGRIISAFPERLTSEQRIDDELTRLGELAKTSDANIIKLPNISASIPQLQAAIKELQGQGYDIPAYPEQNIHARFSKVLGSAVNPVLREGNSDRRAATSVKSFAQKVPHKMMKKWPATDSRARVAHMQAKDFFDSERSLVISDPCDARIEFIGDDESNTILKDNIALQDGEVIDTAVMNVRALREFYEHTMGEARRDGALLSLHLKATMMKVSDPVMFGHCVSVYYQEALDKHADALKEAGANLNNGLQGVLDKLQTLPPETQTAIKAALNAVYGTRPALAMVDSRKGITNLHIPNNVIIDASMPNIVRDGGKMWNDGDELQDTVAMIPDRSYATMYQAILEDCQAHGQFDPSTMGSVSNVGLMAQKAEEYGSHDKTFMPAGDGIIRVVDSNGCTLLEQQVCAGDIFRMCQTKDEPIREWVKLAVTRARASNTPAIFWLNRERAHDASIIAKVNT